MVSLKQSRWLVALDRNPVYRIMSVCPSMHVPVHVRTYVRTALVPARVLKVLAHRTTSRGINFRPEHNRNFISPGPVIVIRRFA